MDYDRTPLPAVYRAARTLRLSSLPLISHGAFARGLREFEDDCRSAERHEPIDETVELFVFSR